MLLQVDRDATADEGSLSPGEIRTAISALEQALYNHVQWTDALNITLICHLQPDARDIDENAHLHCRLGQWYYGDAAINLRHNPNFIELEAAHHDMHEDASHLLSLSQSGQEISIAEYDRFTRNMNRLRLQILTLKQELEDQIYSQDSLTGASNRLGMLTKIRENHELVKRKLESCVVVMMDIDNFKRVNDTYGHAAGDRALAAFAHHVMRHTRPFDRLFRYGGEEFLLCVPHANIESALEMIERIRISLYEMTIECDGHEPFHISASFGLAQLDPDASITESIERADLAVYAAKEAGRDRSVVWNVSMQAKKAS